MEEKRVTNGEMLLSPNTTSITTQANGYSARPQTEGSNPGIVMIHENRGLNSGVRSMADQLAKEGYMVLRVCQG